MVRIWWCVFGALLISPHLDGYRTRVALVGRYGYDWCMTCSPRLARKTPKKATKAPLICPRLGEVPHIKDLIGRICRKSHACLSGGSTHPMLSSFYRLLVVLVWNAYTECVKENELFLTNNLLNYSKIEVELLYVYSIIVWKSCFWSTPQTKQHMVRIFYNRTHTGTNLSPTLH